MQFVVVMAVIAAFIAVMACIAMMLDRVKKTNALKAADPEKVLAERFARGEIDESEYARRLAILRMGPPLDVPLFPPPIEPPPDDDD